MYNRKNCGQFKPFGFFRIPFLACRQVANMPGQNGCSRRIVIPVNPFPNKPWILRVWKSFQNTVGKGEIARNEQFLLFPQVFDLFGELSTLFINMNCHLLTL